MSRDEEAAPLSASSMLLRSLNDSSWSLKDDERSFLIVAVANCCDDVSSLTAGIFFLPRAALALGKLTSGSTC